MKNVLAVTSIAEAATGLALVVFPSVVGRLLLGVELYGVALVIARVAGIALVALGVACWPGRTPLCGMLTYNGLATVYLTYVGFVGEWVGPLLWPAAVIHAVLTGVFLCAVISVKRSGANADHRA